MKEKTGGISLMILSIYFGFITFDGKAPIPTGLMLVLHLVEIGLIFSAGIVVIIFKAERKNWKQQI
ncbi:MAG: hypothetical protein IPO06_19725 [Leptospiraceae bacterium]|nr:hypothetical protein [Leptospiraceae bacterium]MBK9501562.1 hypothetical protein [Leptospiraceae bacterium]